MSEHNQHQSTQLNSNVSHFIPRQKHDPVPLQLLKGSPQQFNPQDNQFTGQQGYNPTQFPQQNAPNKFPKLAQLNSDLVLPGEML